MLKVIAKRAKRPADSKIDSDLPQMPSGQVLRRLFQYLRPYRRRMALTIVIYMICVTIGQLYPFIDRILLDNYIAQSRIDQTFYMVVAVAVVLHIFNYGGFMVRSLSIVGISQDLLFDLRT
ncbi:MAG TPA: hypothetical protein VGK81_14145, partial [Anaerolineae bacterium]